jgi:hypothetical protein
MSKAPEHDIYLILETEVRTPKERLLIDAFLPPAGAIPSQFARPAAPPPPAPDAPPAAALRQILGAAAPDADAPEEAPPQRKRRVRRNAADEPQKSLEEEVAEFLSRSSRALAPDPDPQD